MLKRVVAIIAEVAGTRIVDVAKVIAVINIAATTTGAAIRVAMELVVTNFNQSVFKGIFGISVSQESKNSPLEYYLAR